MLPSNESSLAPVARVRRFATLAAPVVRYHVSSSAGCGR
jgi:hypothetical protein